MACSTTILEASIEKDHVAVMVQGGEKQGTHVYWWSGQMLFETMERMHYLSVTLHGRSLIQYERGKAFPVTVLPRWPGAIIQGARGSRVKGRFQDHGRRVASEGDTEHRATQVSDPGGANMKIPTTGLTRYLTQKIDESDESLRSRCLEGDHPAGCCAINKNVLNVFPIAYRS